MGKKLRGTLADRVRKARGKLSRQDVALLMHAAGVIAPVSWIRDIETGMVLNPGFERMATLAHVLNVSLSDLEGS